MWLIHHINGIKHALRVLPVIAAVAKVSCKHGLWLVARVNMKSLAEDRVMSVCQASLLK